MAKIGYARVSTDEQSVELQILALRRAGCEKIYSDRGVSGAVFSRPGLISALKCARAGDTIVVWKLDRLGRSLRGLVQIIASLGERKVQFASLSECIDTSTPGGLLIYHLMGALAEFERALISERTRAGMEAAKLRGLRVGRPRALSQQELEQLAHHLGQETMSSLAQRFGINVRTLRRYVREIEREAT
ncbi:recombinase family protein [uncultured Pseudacidovorax sp.]|uniref:recombinase family protein n=1 Tax=uncultured Pseudacidovorax sp. TaxID=679313 RepID=UPI0025E485ED|nr:recombinase family protein [uncultured Pseudacidovorax sp.]